VKASKFAPLARLAKTWGRVGVSACRRMSVWPAENPAIAAIMKTKLVRHFRELEVYKNAIGFSMAIFKISKNFPAEEKYSLTDQVRRSSRSVCANIAEAWRKRCYKAAFIAKISDAETEAIETQVWCEIAYLCEYIDEKTFLALDDACDHAVSQLVRMADSADRWTSRARKHADTPSRPHADTRPKE
jgi:four helix bundle protein